MIFGHFHVHPYGNLKTFYCDRREPLLWILGKNGRPTDRPTVTLEVTLGNARVGEGLGRWSGVGDGVSGGFSTR